MESIFLDYRLFAEVLNLLLALGLGTMTVIFLRKNIKRLEKGAVFLVLGFFLLAILQLFEVYNAATDVENYIIKPTIKIGIMLLIIAGLIIETRSVKDQKYPFEIVYEK